jgi:RimJ/RimL family protein N-acetyltransferase
MTQGKRVSLRPFRREDLPRLRRWRDDGEVMQYWGERMPVLVEGWFEAHLGPGGRFTVFDQCGYFCICDDGGRAIGLLQYEGSARRDRRAELGVLIGEKDAWNQGYGTEAVVVLLNWLFNHQGWHRVWLTVQANNPRAIHVYEKIGFTREGILRQHNFYDGQWQDEPIYGMLAGEFNGRYRPERTGWAVTGEVPQAIWRAAALRSVAAPGGGMVKASAPVPGLHARNLVQIVVFR